MKKRICILYTGGTIGMVPTENGYAPKKGYFYDAIAAIPDLNSHDMPEWDMIEFDPLNSGTRLGAPSVITMRPMTVSWFFTEQTPWLTPPLHSLLC